VHLPLFAPDPDDDARELYLPPPRRHPGSGAA